MFSGFLLRSKYQVPSLYGTGLREIRGKLCSKAAVLSRMCRLLFCAFREHPASIKSIPRLLSAPELLTANLMSQLQNDWKTTHVFCLLLLNILSVCSNSKDAARAIMFKAISISICDSPSVKTFSFDAKKFQGELLCSVLFLLSQNPIWYA